MQYILHYDKQRYVYMRDMHTDHLVFAVEKNEHDIFTDIVSIYNCEPMDVPDDYTLEVMRMTEVSDDVFSLTETKPIRYPMNHLEYLVAMPLGDNSSIS